MSRQLRLSRTIPRFFVCLQFVGAPRGGQSGEKSGGRQGKEFDSEFRLGRARPVGLQPTDFDPWASTPWGGRDKDVDARIKSAQDDFNLFRGSPTKVLITGKSFAGQPCAR